MGHSSSKFDPHDSGSYDPTISKPKPLDGGHLSVDTTHQASGGFRRARSTSGSRPSRHLLGLPEFNTHRRAKSALAGSTQNAHRESFSLPPPYTSVIDTQQMPIPIIAPVPSTVSSPTTQTNDASAFADAQLGSRNPFLDPSILGSNLGATQPRSQMVSRAERLAYLRRPMRQESVEDALETLRKYNTVIIVDDSGSMQGKRWREAREALAALADIASKYDTDGIDVCFLNNSLVGQEMKSGEGVRALFDRVSPRGITPIGGKLEQLLLYYLDELERAKARADTGNTHPLDQVKPVNYIILTDGAPTDDPEDVIVTAARRLDAGNFPLTQVGIQFVQIGNSEDATAFLNDLDNGLGERYKVRDMVDTTPYLGSELNAEIIIKILLGGINRRVDRKGGQSVL